MSGCKKLLDFYRAARSPRPAAAPAGRLAVEGVNFVPRGARLCC